MKKIFLLLPIILFACKSATAILRPEGVFKDAKGDAPETVIVDKAITNETVGKIIGFLASDELKGREAGSVGIEAAANFIENIYNENHIKPYFLSYKDTLNNFEKPAYNIVGYLEGNDNELKKEFIIIGAHYDHIGFGQAVENDSIANGANDNASGTAAVVELAKYFGNARTNKRSLMFVAFSAEEKGLLGAAHLAKKLKDDHFNLYALVNFEMIGVPMNTVYKACLTGFEVSNMAAKMNEYAGKELIGFLPQEKEYELFKRSDNYPFYTEFNLPSQTVFTFDFTNFDYYHHVKDEISEMDFNHVADLINDMVPVLEKMASSQTQEIQLNK